MHFPPPHHMRTFESTAPKYFLQTWKGTVVQLLTEAVPIYEYNDKTPQLCLSLQPRHGTSFFGWGGRANCSEVGILIYFLLFLRGKKFIRGQCPYLPFPGCRPTTSHQLPTAADTECPIYTRLQILFCISSLFWIQGRPRFQNVPSPKIIFWGNRQKRSWVQTEFENDGKYFMM